MESIVIFGAGKIGRSFIGQVFSTRGYEIVFVEIDKFLVNELNYHKQYNVIVKDERDAIIPVFNMRAIHLSDEESILNALDQTTISAVSVGLNGLPSVMKILAQSLERRQHRRPGTPLDLIIAENLPDSRTFLKEELKKHLSENFLLEKNIGLIEASIDKMVPVAAKEHINRDSLLLYAEAYNKLIVSKKNFLNPIPEFPELVPKENIKAWVDRKLMIQNFGHISIAYIAAIYHPEFIYIWEALADKAVYDEVYETMKESATILQSLYPGEFTSEELDIHILDLLRRFANKALGDSIYRVGFDLSRKLGPDGRIVPLIRQGFINKLPYEKILKVLIYGINFPAKDETGKMIESDRRFISQYACSLEKILENHCKFQVNEEKGLFKDALKIQAGLNKKIVG